MRGKRANHADANEHLVQEAQALVLVAELILAQLVQVSHDQSGEWNVQNHDDCSNERRPCLFVKTEQTTSKRRMRNRRTTKGQQNERTSNVLIERIQHQCDQNGRSPANKLTPRLNERKRESGKDKDKGDANKR